MRPCGQEKSKKVTSSQVPVSGLDSHGRQPSSDGVKGVYLLKESFERERGRGCGFVFVGIVSSVFESCISRKKSSRERAEMFTGRKREFGQFMETFFPMRLEKY